MVYKLSDIVYETKNHWVVKIPTGYRVYETGVTCSKPVATIGYTGDEGLARAKREIECREKAATP